MGAAGGSRGRLEIPRLEPPPPGEQDLYRTASLKELASLCAGSIHSSTSHDSLQADAALALGSISRMASLGDLSAFESCLDKSSE
mmetsp:Transcript_27046/g.84937  ORF Transcript_27046/g.84937 Transcript_27046/m.84937 type:complete len:85 (-) Transcript_27046:56-310(-)